MEKDSGAMKKYKKVSILVCGILSVILVDVVPLTADEPYQERVPGFRHLKSRVMIRSVAVPTRARLDFAAYDRNPVLVDPPPRKKGGKVKGFSTDVLTFGGALEKTCLTFSEVPLTGDERQQPLSWKPLLKQLWTVVKDDHLATVGAAIAATKWGVADAAYQPYQEITTAYLHDNNGTTEIWVKIECAPWAKFFRVIPDEDKDGVREFYGKLTEPGMHSDSLAKGLLWIRDDYTRRVLTREEALDWVTDLASYWYPTRNTDILSLEPGTLWPDEQVSRKVQRQLKGVTVKEPLAVVEGKPFSPDRPVYNVFIIPQSKKETGTHTTSPVKKIVRHRSGSVASVNYQLVRKQLDDEQLRYGPYPKWVVSNQPFYAALSQKLSELPSEQMSIPGSDGWLFFRKSLEVIPGTALGMQPDSCNPLVHIAAFKNFLSSRDIDMLFVVVPDKAEVYADMIDSAMVSPAVPLIKPYGRKFLASLQHQGVEVIDLLPHFIAARKDDVTSGESLYQKQDTHWSSRGLQLAAELIAGRVTQYSWYGSCDTVAYSVTDTVIERSGDLPERLPAQKRNEYPPLQTAARRVLLSNGVPFRATNPDAPILLVGDSFTGVYELIDCKSAGVGAHIALQTRLPVDIITSWGGGPMVRQKMLRVRGKVLERKQLVIYLMVARDLFEYTQGWEPLKVPAGIRD